MVKIDIDGKSIVELRQQLKGLRDDLARATDPEEMAQLAQAAGTVRDKMKDLNEQVAVFAAGSKFEQASIAIGQIGGDLGNLDFEGASEKAAKLTTIVKSISFAEATKGLGELGTTFLNLGKALLTNPLFLIPAVITGILGALGLLGPILDGVKKLFELLSNTVNDFLISLGLVKPAIKEVSEEEKKAAEAAQEHADTIAKEVTGFKLLITQLANTNAGSKERKTLIKQINEQYGTTLKNIKNEDKFQAQLNATVDNYLKFVKQKILLQGYEAEYSKTLRDRILIEEKLADLQKEKDTAESINKRAKALKDEADKYRQLWKEQDQTTSEGRKLAKSYKEQEVALNDRARAMESSVVSTVALDFEMNALTSSLNDNIQKEKELDKKYLDGTKTLNSFKFGVTSTGKEVKNTTEKFEKLSLKIAGVKDEFKKVEKSTPIMVSALATMYTEMAALAERDRQAKLKMNADTLAGKLAILEDEKQKELANKELTELEKLEIEKRYAKQSEDLTKENAEKEKAERQAVVDFWVESAATGFDLVGDLANAFSKDNEKSQKKAFEINKVAAIAETTVTTYLAAQKAYASQINPLDPTSPVRAAVAAGLAITAGIARIAAISKTQFKSSTPSGNNPGGNNPGPSATPQFNLFGNNNNQNTTNASNNQPINIQNEVKVKAYVSETEITDSQKRVARYQNSATL